LAISPVKRKEHAKEARTRQQWTFNLAAGTTPQPLHIGAKLSNSTGLNGQIVSESSFAVPDGSKTLSLLGLALAGMGIVRRRIR
jgi:hypothetical protein